MKSARVLLMLAATGAVAAPSMAGMLSLYNDGDLGGLILDEAVAGGADLRDDFGGATFNTYEYTGLWSAGDSISITGIAIPLWVGNTNATNTTLNGTFTFTFYELDGGANTEQYGGEAIESVIGSATLDFSDQGLLSNTTPRSAIFGGLFDSSIDFTAASSGFAVRVQSTAAVRMKLGPQPSSGRRIRYTDGNRVGNAGANNQYGALTFAGIVPTPGVFPALALAGFGFASRRQR